jgi:hypothetical protein
MNVWESHTRSKHREEMRFGHPRYIYVPVFFFSTTAVMSISYPLDAALLWF